MASLSSKSARPTGVSSVSASQRLTKVEEDLDNIETERKDVSTKIARAREETVNLGLDRRKLTEKEERFRNKYRWAEKQHKLRTGKCEGYSFFSIKAGLHKQDFRDTINWSPINHARAVETPHHLSDVVTKLLHTHPHHTGMNASLDSADDYSMSHFEDDEGNTSLSQPSASDRMSERDWQLARSRKLDPLRSRGANRLGAHMNLDSFIDSALSEQIKESDKIDAPSDMSLGELQSPKLIESRFKWSKVRRAINTSSSVKATIKTPKHESPTAEGAFTFDDFGVADSVKEEAFAQPTTRGANNQPDPSPSEKVVGMIEIGSIDSSGKYVASVPMGRKSRVQNNAPSGRPSTAGATIDRPSNTSTQPQQQPQQQQRAHLSFSVPESATYIRPRSAVVTPARDMQCMVAPLHDFVEVVRQEVERPKTSSGIAETSKSTTLSARPRTATLRIAPPLPILSAATPAPVTDADMIQAMLTVAPPAEDVEDGQMLQWGEKHISGNYSGLIYHDPGRHATWRGVSDLLAPPPYLGAKGLEQDAAQRLRALGNTDKRWAGKTLNSYRPWSPVRQPPVQQPATLTMLDTAQVNNNTTHTATTPGSSSRNNSARLSARVSTPKHVEETTAPNTLTTTVATDPTTASAAASVAQESPKKLRRPASEMMVKQAAATSVSTLDSGSTRVTSAPPTRQIVRHLSSPSIPVQQATTSRRSSSPMHALSAASEAATVTATVRPFSARPETAGGSTRSAGRLPSAPPGGRSSSNMTATPARSSFHSGTPSATQQAGSSAFSSQAPSTARSSSATGKRPPLLINLITRQSLQASVDEDSALAVTAPNLASWSGTSQQHMLSPLPSEEIASIRKR